MTLPSNLERIFLSCFSILGFILLINNFTPPQVIFLSIPRPYYGRPTRPTTPRPRPMETNINMVEHRKMMGERRKQMLSVCRRNGDEIKHPKGVGQKLMWDLNHHLVFCPIYKVASGTWTTNFLRLKDFNSDLPKWQRFSKLYNASEGTARKSFPAPKKKRQQRDELKVATKFLVVRHPFDRIVSAFKGKIAKADAKPRFYRTLQKKIKEKYSQNEEEIKNGLPPTFQEYWRYLIDLTKGLLKPKEWRGVDCVQAYYSMCYPCNVEYDMILKLETHAEDTEFLIRERNLTELMEPFTMWKHNSQSANQIGDYDYYLYEEEWRNPKHFAKKESTGTDSAKISRQLEMDVEKRVDEKIEYKRTLFKQLTKSEIKSLYNNYKIDFEMFDYNIDDFLRYAKNS